MQQQASIFGQHVSRVSFSPGAEADSLPAYVSGLNNRRGSIVLYFMLVMATLVTGTLATMSMLSNTETTSAGVAFDRSSAFYAAEAGIQQALWNAKNNPNFTTWLQNLTPQTLSNHCTYTLNLTSGNWPTLPLTFQAVGQSADGQVVSQASATISLDGYCPGLAIGGQMRDNGTLNVAGSLMVVGNVTRNGTTTMTNVEGQPTSSLKSMGNYLTNGTFNVPGDVLFNGYLTTNGTLNASGNVQFGNSNPANSYITNNGTLNVGGDILAVGAITSNGTTIAGNVQSGTSVYHNGTWTVGSSSVQSTSGPNLSFGPPAVDTATLIAQAQEDGTVTTLKNGSQNGTLNIDLNSGSHHVWLIQSSRSGGSVSFNGSPTISPSGTGTIIINAPATSFNGSFAMSGNLVTTGNFTNNGTVNVTGSICVGGDFNKNGNIVANNGVIVVQNDLTSNGTVTTTYGTPPWFVDWMRETNAKIVVTDFTGPTY